MTLHPDEQARELFYELKPECQAHADGCKGCAEAIASIAALLAKARLQEWIAAPVHAWPDDGTTYPQEFGAELVKYRNKRIIELEANLRQAAGEGTK